MKTPTYSQALFTAHSDFISKVDEMETAYQHVTAGTRTYTNAEIDAMAAGCEAAHSTYLSLLCARDRTIN